MTYSSIKIRTGHEESLVSEFLRMDDMRQLKLTVLKLDNPDLLEEENILAVHYADSGAQGEAGVVKILYRSRYGVQILRGNYVYGNLNLYAVIQKLPMLSCLNSYGQFDPPYPFGGRLDIPVGWGYLYMGAMNHFFARKEICDKTSSFIKTLLNQGGGSWQVFDAVAWLCGA